jgi:hypothetical protein
MLSAVVGLGPLTDVIDGLLVRKLSSGGCCLSPALMHSAAVMDADSF